MAVTVNPSSVVYGKLKYLEAHFIRNKGPAKSSKGHYWAFRSQLQEYALLLHCMALSICHNWLAKQIISQTSLRLYRPLESRKKIGGNHAIFRILGNNIILLKST